MKLHKEWCDEQMEWFFRIDLHCWLVGFSIYRGGFHVAIGPFSFGRSDLPF